MITASQLKAIAEKGRIDANIVSTIEIEMKTLAEEGKTAF